MKWHAPHPLIPRRPLCGTVGEDGNPTYRVATFLPVTCERCKRAIAKLTGGSASKPASAKGATNG